ncbi:WD40/YVTN/BNR-like repeat-containing protein [Zunongwangia sp.]|uniref:WD40/YVTN/BNR-like repeat-containing protein n=1 Tax=Zunongwangia sp. TaxID=1965325 RepID=UPI003AA895DB
MKKIWIMALLAVIACKNETNKGNVVNASEADIVHTPFNSVKIESILENDSLSIRAIKVIGKNLAFAANKGTYGLFDNTSGNWKLSQQKRDIVIPEFRAIGSTANDFFMLSVGNPALLYKTGDDGSMKLVYTENNEKVFYDAIAFWNDKEGIAMGDPTDDCLSVIITRDGGNSWQKVNCNELPKAAEGEAAFAASNSNIAIEGNEVWLLSGGTKSRVYHSADKGESWEVFDTPLVQGKPTLGGYSMDFYDAKHGIIIGGDYTNPENNTGNKAVTEDGGKTWKLVAEGQEPGYKSSVRYVPNGKGKEIVAAGFTGISYSKDKGETWKSLSKEGFFSIRFLNDSTAYAAGSKRIAKLHFK